MKKLSLVIFTVLFSLTSYAQTESGDITLAPKIGYSFATYSSDAEFDARNAFTFGVNAEYYLNDRWSLRSGLIYDALGAEDSLDNIDKLNYLTIPFNANWHFGRNRNWYLNFGPAVAFLLDGKGELSNGTEVDLNDVISGTDIGFTAGIGYRFEVSENLMIFIDLQNYNGLTDILDVEEANFELRNARTSFNVGAIFRL